MMRLIVFGAAGSVGGAVVAEALARGHEVTATVRRAARLAAVPAGARAVVAGATDAAEIARLAAGHDAVVGATRPPAGRESELVAVGRALLAGAEQAGVRLMLVGGAATLTVPGSAGRRLVDDPLWCPPAYRAIAQACVEQHRACMASTADWTYLSPPAELAPGPRTGRYRLGADELLVDEAGMSTVSVADLAAALVDELELPAHRRARFTVAS